MRAFLSPVTATLCRHARIRTSSSLHGVASAGFGASVVEAYERGRPTYRDADTDLLLRASGALTGALASPTGHFPSKPILELACGTGKFTRVLLGALERAGGPGTKPNVALVDPAGMGAHAAASFPSLQFTRTTADSLGHLDDGSVHAVVAAQAFHWFADAPSLREIKRVLRPGGQLLLIWNKRNRSASPLMGALEVLLDEFYALADVQGALKTPRHNEGAWRDVFNTAPAQAAWLPLQSTSVEWPYVGTADQFVDWMLSISVVSQLDAKAKAEVASRTRRILFAHSDAIVSGASAAPGICHDQPGALRYSVPLFTDLAWTSKCEC